MTATRPMDDDVKAAIIQTPNFFDILVPVGPYTHLHVKATGEKCRAWIHVQRVASGDASVYPVKGEGGQWKWAEIVEVRKHVESVPTSNLLRIPSPSPKTWETVTGHDEGAMDALRLQLDAAGGPLDALEGLSSAGWILVRRDTTPEG